MDIRTASQILNYLNDEIIEINRMIDEGLKYDTKVIDESFEGVCRALEGFDYEQY